MNDRLKLFRLKRVLEENTRFRDTYIRIPSTWIDPFAKGEYVQVPAVDYCLKAVNAILEKSEPDLDYGKSLSTMQGSTRRWARQAVLYNAFPRLTAAFDHDGNHTIGQCQIDLTLNEKGIRDSGTLLKMILLLPYIQALGADTLYLLPVNRIGKDRRKGNMGSPYATADLMAIEPTLCDPLLDGLSAQDQFAALVEAAHILGMRVVLEFALRTSAPDNVNVKQHPDWFYWIRRSQAPHFEKPRFTPAQLQRIRRIPAGEQGFVSPSAQYRALFTSVPASGDPSLLGDRYVADTPQGQAVVAPAFADWPPDDIQPAWDDVTYFRMFRDPDDRYNYMAYDTLRYYAPLLAKNSYANTDLWEYLSHIIPAYQQQYGIDGSMVDMGHAIPENLVRTIVNRARAADPSFAFFEENFYPQAKDPKADKTYDAALGFAFESTWDSLWRVVEYACGQSPEPIFGSLETHNTPRAAERGGEQFSKAGYAVFCFLPSVLPMIHSGFELLETFPVNTGLGFTPEQTAFYAREKLPLFDIASLNWLAETNITHFIARINALRKANIDLVCDTSPRSLDIPHVESPGDAVKAYRRIRPEDPARQIVVVLNTDTTAPRKFYMHIPYAGDRQAQDVVSGFVHTFTNDWLSYRMEPGQVIVLDLGACPSDPSSR